ncbi:MAG: transposase family protein [Janthinobacterium lividum]
MRTDIEWSPGPGVKVSAAIRLEDGWVVSAVMSGGAECPACGTHSSRRHGWYVRHLQDLPAQGAAVKLALKVTRWQCLKPECTQWTFGDRGPQIVAPYGRRTRRVVDLARVFAHTAGGRPAGRLMTCLGVPQSQDTLLRSLKRGLNKRTPAAAVRVVGVDD